VVRHRRLADRGAGIEVARADLAVGRELADDRETDRVRECGEQLDVRVAGARHRGQDIDAYLY
jgi:hypothetical protein